MDRGSKIHGRVGLYIRPDGRFVAVAHHGKSHKSRICATIAEAEAWQAGQTIVTKPHSNLNEAQMLEILRQRTLEESFLSGYDPKENHPVPVDLVGLMAYLLPEKAKLRDWKNQRRYWLAMLEYFGNRDLASFTTRDFKFYRESLEGGRAVATVNRYLEAPFMLLKVAHRGGWIPIMPAIAMRNENNRRVLRFGLDDVLAVMDALPKPPMRHRALVAMAINTGQRLGDLRRIRWNDIAGQRILVRSSKTDSTGTLIPLWEITRRELGMLEQTSEWIFESYRRPGHPLTKILKSLTSACKRAGVPRFTHHSLRNVAISIWQYHLQDPAKTARLLGTTIQNVIRYSMAEYWARAATPAIDATIHALTVTESTTHRNRCQELTHNDTLNAFGLTGLRNVN